MQIWRPSRNTPSDNVKNILASEANAAAKTNGAFDAATPFYERVPWRARPPYEC